MGFCRHQNKLLDRAENERLQHSLYLRPQPQHTSLATRHRARRPNSRAWGLNSGAGFWWDVTEGQRIGDPLTGHSARITSLAFSPDGSTLASASRDKSIILWDVNTGKQRIGPLLGHDDVIT